MGPRTILIHLLTAALAGLWAVPAGAAPAAVAARPAGEAMLARVRALAAPALAGRGNGTPEALAAADTIAAWFAAAGLAPDGAAGWFQDFPLQGGELTGRPARNVIGRLPGRGALASRWLVIGAHYDHLGPVRGEGPGGRYHPGADDNASGVAVLVEVARRLAAAEAAGGGGPAARAVVFVAFAGEEDGLQGSARFVRDLPAPRDSLDAMLNLDSVGRLRDRRLYVAGVGTSPALPALVAAADVAAGLDLEISRGGWEASDHVSFNAIGVPVLFLLTGPHEQYHSPADDWPLVDPAGLVAVADFARDLADGLRTWPQPLVYTAVAEPPPARRAADARNEAGGGPRRAWFGVIPDFVEGAGGVKLAGVMPGSPAAAAGLARGDLLVGFAGRPVADLQAYTRELYAHAPRDTVTV
ncbi:MAG: M28 family peptidase, partial [Candidatus Krumholzibacteriia bacterium]